MLGDARLAVEFADEMLGVYIYIYLANVSFVIGDLSLQQSILTYNNIIDNYAYFDNNNNNNQSINFVFQSTLFLRGLHITVI